MGGNNAEGRVEGQPAEVSTGAIRALRLVEMKAAADRARSEGERTQVSTDAAAGGPSNDGKAVEGDTAATSGKDAGTDATPVAKATESSEPAKSTDSITTPEPGKDAKGDPLPDSDPFWKTGLGRKISKMTADLTEEIVVLKAKMALLNGGKPKAEVAGNSPSDEDAMLEAELALGEDADKVADDGKAKPTAEDPAKIRAEYQLGYLKNFAEDKYVKDPDFAEVKALMLNKEDPANTYNKTHWGHPQADFNENFRNAKAFIEAERRKVESAASSKPGADRLKNESPTAALGVGGDTKGTDTRSEAKVPKLDAHAQNFVKYLERKGRGHIVEKAFAVDLRGASRSGP